MRDAGTPAPRPPGRSGAAEGKDQPAAASLLTTLHGRGRAGGALLSRTALLLLSIGRVLRGGAAEGGVPPRVLDSGGAATHFYLTQRNAPSSSGSNSIGHRGGWAFGRRARPHPGLDPVPRVRDGAGGLHGVLSGPPVAAA